MGLVPMEIKGSSRIESGNVRKLARGTGTSGGTFTIPDAPEPVRAATVAAPGPLTALESILTLQNVDGAASGRHENFADPKLQGVLDEIELRAKVELAKLEQADGTAA